MIDQRDTGLTLAGTERGTETRVGKAREACSWQRSETAGNTLSSGPVLLPRTCLWCHPFSGCLTHRCVVRVEHVLDEVLALRRDGLPARKGELALGHAAKHLQWVGGWSGRAGA